VKRYILISAVLLSWLLPVLVQAQDGIKTVVHPTAIEFTHARSLWFSTGNAAGLAINPLSRYSQVSSMFKLSDGVFKFQQQGTKENDIQFNATGALSLGGISLWGDFTFSNITTKDSRFNTMLYEPFRQMPYYVGDPVSSEWKKQLYNLRMKFATPLMNNLFAFGCEIDYTSKTGAKQNDPRSSSYYYNILVRPGVVVKVGGNHYLGLNGEYENMFERTNPTNSNSQQDQPVYIMRGLGNYYSGTIGGVGGLNVFYYKSDRIGGGFQYGYNGNLSVLLDLKYALKIEDAFQTPSKPQNMGSTKQIIKEGNLQIVKVGKYTSKVTVDYLDKNTDGIEYIQVVDKSYDVQRWVTVQKYIRSNYRFNGASVKYDIFKGTESGYSWRAGLSGEYTNVKDIFYSPRSVFEAENMFGSIYGKKNIKLGEKSFLLLGLNAGYNSNIGGQFDYNGADPNSIVITEFYDKDFAYLTSDYYRTGLSITYSIAVGKKSNTVFANGDCQIMKPTSGSDSRLNALLSVGFTF
jgi:hypothetical protein